MNEMFQMYLSTCSKCKAELEDARKHYFSSLEGESSVDFDQEKELRRAYERSEHDYDSACRRFSEFIAEHADSIRFE